LGVVMWTAEVMARGGGRSSQWVRASGCEQASGAELGLMWGIVALAQG
jgi:hypothetical protein